MPKFFLLFLVATLTAAAAAAQPAPGFQLVVHSDNPATELEREKVAAFFLLAGQIWSDGTRVEPVAQRPDSPVENAFRRAIHRDSAAAVEHVWKRAEVRRRANPPTLDGDREVLEWVSAHRGAIGYVSPAAARTAGVKVVKLTGREEEEVEPETPRRVSLVVDASGSMGRPIRHRAKIEIARETIGDFLAEWDPEVELGLTAFGHRGPLCDDIETLVPLGDRRAERIKAALAALAARGSTPLTQAVRHAAAELREAGEEETRIVLVSDGEETCGGNPCELAAELAAEGVAMTAYVVGFDILRNPTAQAQLRCLADQSGGTFELAWDEKSLRKALGAALERATSSRVVSAEAAPRRLEPAPADELEADLDLRWQFVKAETFMMGSPKEERGHERDESYRQAELKDDFWITDTEITQGDWRRLMGNNPSYFSGCDHCPVERISWYDALAFANHLSTLSGFEPCYELQECQGRAGGGCTADSKGCKGSFYCSRVLDHSPDCEGFRLPTEAEWEYAARAGSESRFWSGEELDPREANCAPDADAARAARPGMVRSFPANPLGLFEVHGNVWEWVAERRTMDDLTPRERSYVQRQIFSGRPTPGMSLGQGVRGGSFADRPSMCRSANRDARDPGKRYHNVGLRLVQTAR